MIRWMSEHTLRDKLHNEDIRKGLGVANIEEKMNETRLRWDLGRCKDDILAKRLENRKLTL